MKKLLATAILLVVTLIAGCSFSKYNRTAKPSVTADEVFSEMSSMSNGGSTVATKGGVDAGTVIQMSETPDAIVYYGGAPDRGMGPVASVGALKDFTIFGLPKVSTKDITRIRIFYVDAPSSPLRAGLLIAIQVNGAANYQVAAFTGSVEASKNSYKATLSALTLQSNDVDSDGNLNKVIQMSVSGPTGSIGKFSTLHGFAH